MLAYDALRQPMHLPMHCVERLKFRQRAIVEPPWAVIPASEAAVVGIEGGGIVRLAIQLAPQLIDPEAVIDSGAVIEIRGSRVSLDTPAHPHAGSLRLPHDAFRVATKHGLDSDAAAQQRLHRHLITDESR